MTKENKPLKRGATREDGMIFWHYHKDHKNGERWVSQEKFKELRERYDLYLKNYYSKNKDTLKQRSKNWAKENPAKRRIQAKRYKEKNRTKINARRSKWANKKLKSDPDFKARTYLRNRINSAISKSSKRSLSTNKLLGCEIAFLRSRIESMFQPGMNWTNWGITDGCWQIDHIKPCSSFDLSKEPEQLACFNYMNLQPLWAKENWEKSDKFDENKTT